MLWIRFFQLAVYATMYVRDHQRPQLNAAMGFDPTDYDFEVFRITRDISTQVFPITLDIENPAFLAGLEKLRVAADRMDAGKARGGIGGALQRAAGAVSGAAAFLRLYLLPTRRKALPEKIRMAPAW